MPDRWRVCLSNMPVLRIKSCIAEGLMKFELYTDVALTCDLPEHRLRRGDIVKLVDRHTVPVSALEPLREDEVLSARTLARS